MSDASRRYGPLDRALHRVAFLPAVQRLVEQAQRRHHGAAMSRQRIEAPVLISGLPRAGSTILLQRLHASAGFASPLYRDMPFVTAPLWWDALTRRNRRSDPARERAHGDGVVTSLDSPEAFDEVLWLRHWPEHYRGERIALWHESAERLAFAADWRRWMQAVLALHGGPTGARLVLKNNANIARLALVQRLLPDALIIVPYRDPGQQAASLLNQHRQASEHQRRHPFARRYMDDLGHFEFGSGHRPMAFPGFLAGGDPHGIGYWLDYWRAAYSHVLDTLPANAWLLDYDMACRDEAAVDAALVRIAGISGDRAGAPALRSPAPRKVAAGAAALTVHARLRAHPRNIV